MDHTSFDLTTIPCRYYIKKGDSIYPSWEGPREVLLHDVFVDVLEKQELGHKVRVYNKYDGTTKIAYVASKFLPGTIRISSEETLIDNGMFNCR